MSEKTRVVQVLPNLSYGDGVGNDVHAIDRLLKKSGYNTHIYAEHVGKRVDKKIVSPVRKMPKLNHDDVILYHLSTGCSLNYRLAGYPGKKVIRYHNVTPPKFFSLYDSRNAVGCREGLQGMRVLRDVADYCLADSAYNKQDLVNAGYKCKIDVVPILIPFEDYRQEPDPSTLTKYSDGMTNILFTGRIVPNKKQEDVIQAFAYYQKYYNKHSRLLLVGSQTNAAVYYDSLQEYVKRLGVENVVFTGHIPFSEILACYKAADLFLCMSEHEGFCIPLIEAMLFEIPIVAYQCTGVEDTLGGNGFPLYNKNPMETAGIMKYILTHKELEARLVKEQNVRLCDFDTAVVEKKFSEALEGWLACDKK